MDSSTEKLQSVLDKACDELQVILEEQDCLFSDETSYFVAKVIKNLNKCLSDTIAITALSYNKKIHTNNWLKRHGYPMRRRLES